MGNKQPCYVFLCLKHASLLTMQNAIPGCKMNIRHLYLIIANPCKTVCCYTIFMALISM